MVTHRGSRAYPPDGVWASLRCSNEGFPITSTAQPGSASEAVAAIQRIAAVPSILEVICRVSGLGFAAIAWISDDRWVACAVRDEISYGLKVGTELDLHTSIGDRIGSHMQPAVIENVTKDPIFHNHGAPKLYGFQSYISVPIVRSSGELFGTLGAIARGPVKLANSAAITAFNLFAQLIALELDAGDRRCG